MSKHNLLRIKNPRAELHNARVSPGQDIIIVLDSLETFKLSGTHYSVSANSDSLRIEPAAKYESNGQTCFIIKQAHDYSALANVNTTFLGNITIYVEGDNSATTFGKIAVFVGFSNETKNIVTVINPSSHKIKIKNEELLEVIIDDCANLMWHPIGLEMVANSKYYLELVHNEHLKSCQEYGKSKSFVCSHRSPLNEQHHFFFRWSAASLSAAKFDSKDTYPGTKLVFFGKDESGTICVTKELKVSLNNTVSNVSTPIIEEKICTVEINSKKRTYDIQNSILRNPKEKDAHVFDSIDFEEGITIEIPVQDARWSYLVQNIKYTNDRGTIFDIPRLSLSHVCDVTDGDVVYQRYLIKPQQVWQEMTQYLELGHVVFFVSGGKKSIDIEFMVRKKHTSSIEKPSPAIITHLNGYADCNRREDRREDKKKSLQFSEVIIEDVGIMTKDIALGEMVVAGKKNYADFYHPDADPDDYMSEQFYKESAKKKAYPSHRSRTIPPTTPTRYPTTVQWVLRLLAIIKKLL